LIHISRRVKIDQTIVKKQPKLHFFSENFVIDKNQKTKVKITFAILIFSSLNKK